MDTESTPRTTYLELEDIAIDEAPTLDGYAFGPAALLLELPTNEPIVYYSASGPHLSGR